MPIQRFVAGGAAGTVTPPATTEEHVAAGVTPTNVTFGAFDDPNGLITSYSASVVSSESATVSGSGLGPYSINGSVDGESGVLTLSALDSVGATVSTAVHVWSVAGGVGATDGSQDTTKWRILDSADIKATVDPNALETSVTMSANEIQFRGGVSAVAGEHNPDDGCMYTFDFIDPDTEAIVEPADGGYIGVEFYYQFGTNTPQGTTNAQLHCGVKEQTSTAALFGGVKFSGGARFVAAGTTTNTQSTVGNFTSTTAQHIRVGLYDHADPSKVTLDGVTAHIYDDATTPGRVSSRLRLDTIGAVTLGTELAVVFASDIDVTIAYRLVKAPSSPF